MTVSASKGAAPAGEWFGHPAGLTILFLTETWTQFSYFGMRAILIYYMTKELLIGQQHASLIYGYYAAAFYFTPIVGGVIADRVLGKYRAVVLGAVLMALGHFMMTFESLFYPAMAAVALGNGFFLPSLSSQINSLYASDDPRLASAYNIYYVGINLGAFVAPLLCGWLGEEYGWHWGFGAAGIGMLIALVTYVFGRRHLPADQIARKAVGSTRSGQMNVAFLGRFALLIGVMLAVVVFRGAYEQNGNSISTWTDAGVDREAGPFLIPLAWFQSINPLLIILLTPFYVAVWTRLARRGREPSSIQKMVVGAIIVGLSYVLCGLAAHFSGLEHARTSGIWLSLYWVVLTIGELFILPVGLGLFGRLAPKGFDATAIATWFFAGFAGNLLAGYIGTLWSDLPTPMFFAVVAGVGFVSAVLLAFFIPAASRAEQTLEAAHIAPAPLPVAEQSAGAAPALPRTIENPAGGEIPLTRTRADVRFRALHPSPSRGEGKT
ncbi:MAG TPA: peptide MFS transporter [Rhizomicrobium sp.]|nr:peptide MFS transporter [Rhizomicrobium sp.]